MTDHNTNIGAFRDRTGTETGTAMTPIRIQRRRTRGFRLQEVSMALNGLECRYVGRPGPLGNPYQTAAMTREQAVRFFRVRWERLRHTPGGQADLARIRGYNLACWCPLDEPFCHADVLLEIANS